MRDAGIEPAGCSNPPHLLGADKRVTQLRRRQYSPRVKQRDPLTAKDVGGLWVKGSGGECRHHEGSTASHALYGEAAAP